MCAASSTSANFRFGSKPDERGHRPGGPHLGVKRTKSGAKRTMPLIPILHAAFAELCYHRRQPWGAIWGIPDRGKGIGETA